jgi:hypothetical protein
LYWLVAMVRKCCLDCYLFVLVYMLCYICICTEGWQDLHCAEAQDLLNPLSPALFHPSNNAIPCLNLSPAAVAA